MSLLKTPPKVCFNRLNHKILIFRPLLELDFRFAAYFTINGSLGHGWEKKKYLSNENIERYLLSTLSAYGRKISEGGTR